MRPEAHVPVVNPIMLGYLGAMVIIFAVIKGFSPLTTGAFLALGISAVALSKSRTAVILLGIYFAFHFYSVAKTRLSVPVLVLAFTLLVLIITNIPSFTDLMRLSTLFNDGLGGRLRLRETGYGESSWGESFTLFIQQPLFGYGNINFQRFLDSKSFSVDNALLQVLLAGGIIGGGLYILYSFFYVPLMVARAIGKVPSEMRLVKGLIMSLNLSFIIRSFSTNGVAYLGIEMISLMLLLSILKTLSYEE